MRILLVNSNREHSPWPVIPLGLCKVAGVLAEEGQDVRVLDLCFSAAPEVDLRDALREFRPDAIGVSVRNIDDLNSERREFYLDDIRAQVIDEIRQWDPEVPLVLGGSAVAVAPAGTLRRLAADHAVVGDGERAAAELFAALAAGEDPAPIPGVLSRERPEVPAGARRIPDLDAHPLARSYRWVDWAAYAAYGSKYGVQTKRGCDRACVYCSYPTIEGRVYRLRDPRRVVDEVQEAHEEGGVESFEFVDSTFNVPRDHALEICRELARRQLPVKLDAMGLNPVTIDAELVEAMVEAGFSEISCTPESGSDPILRRLGKGFTRADVARAARVLTAAGLPTKWWFLFGGAGETAETVAETFAFIDEHIPTDHLVIAMTGIRVLPGTPLERIVRAEGKVAEGETLLEPRYYHGTLDQASLSSMVADEVARRPHCCGTTQELWNFPWLMQAVVTLRQRLGFGGTGWGMVRAYHRVRRLWERPPW